MRVILMLLFPMAAFTCGAQRVVSSGVDSMLRTLDPEKKDTGQVFTLLRIAEWYVDRPGELPADQDSARAFIARARVINAIRPTSEGNGYITLVESMLFRETPGEGMTARRTCERAVSILRSGGNAYLLGKAWLALSFYVDWHDSVALAERISYIQNALSCFDHCGDVHLQGYCYENLADLYRNRGDHLNALKCGLLAVERYKRCGYPNIQGPYVNLCLIYAEGYEYDKALGAGLEALRALKANNDSSQQFCQIYYAVGGLYSKLFEYDTAISYLHVAFDWAARHNDVEDIYVVLNALTVSLDNNNQSDRSVALLESTMRKWPFPDKPGGDLYDKLRLYRDLVGAYSRNGQSDKARPWCDSLLAKVNSFQGNRYFIYYVVIEYYWYARQFTTCRSFVPALMHEMRSMPDTAMKRNGYHLLFRLDTAQHRYGEAVTDLLQYHNINDSIFSAQKSRQIQRLRVGLSLEEKEHNITLLQKESELQKQQIASSHLRFDISVAGALLIFAVGFGRYRLKQRQNRQLAEKQLEISAKNYQLEKLLKENDWLLHEVHHRVKNNLQLVMGLLHSQSASLHDEAAINAVLESQHRVQCMSLIHQKLYKSRTVTAIAMDEYIGDLLAYLAGTVRPGQHILIERSIQAVTIDVVQAIPLGLIINEVVTNAIKYAFPDEGTGRISVRLSLVSDDRISLHIADDGMGLPVVFDPRAGDSFGIRLIYGLAEDLDADVHFDTSRGLAWELSFRRLRSAP